MPRPPLSNNSAVTDAQADTSYWQLNLMQRLGVTHPLTAASRNTLPQRGPHRLILLNRSLLRHLTQRSLPQLVAAAFIKQTQSSIDADPSRPRNQEL